MYNEENCIMIVFKHNHVTCIMANCIYDTYVAYDYNGELVSIIGNQRVGIFPPKSEILFSLRISFI